MKKIIGLLLGMVVLSIGSPISISADKVDRELDGDIIYSILVDRYNNGDADNDEQVRREDPHAYQGGDIQGIIDKLDTYEELGYTTLVLSPLMENAPDGYHGYWVEDFYAVDSQFGTMEDIQKLVSETHERDIKVVMEYVTNYVATSHPLVEDPEKQDWIKDDQAPDTPWGDNVVSLNQENPKVEEMLIDAASFWVNETGIDGLKLHAADQASQNFLEKFTKAMKEIDENIYLLGDVLNNDIATADLPQGTGIQKWDDPSLRAAIVSTFSEPGNAVDDIYEQQEGSDIGLVYVDDQSTKRFTQVFSENGRNALTTWSLVLTYMYMTPGTPSLFQGSELPMYGSSTEEVQEMVKFNSGDPDLTEFHNRISSLKKQFPVFSHGDFELVGSSGAMSIFKRSYDNQTAYIAINNGEETEAITLTDINQDKQLRGYLHDDTVRVGDDGGFKVGLSRESAEVYIVQEDKGYNWLFIGFVVAVFIVFIVGIVILSRKQKRKSV